MMLFILIAALTLHSRCLWILRNIFLKAMIVTFLKPVLPLLLVVMSIYDSTLQNESMMIFFDRAVLFVGAAAAAYCHCIDSPQTAHDEDLEPDGDSDEDEKTNTNAPRVEIAQDAETTVTKDAIDNKMQEPEKVKTHDQRENRDKGEHSSKKGALAEVDTSDAHTTKT